MPEIFNRKQEHLDICLTQDVSSRAGTGFDRYRFGNRALPGCDFSQVTTWTTFLDKPIAAPLLLGSITGGTAKGREINRNLAAAAQALRIGMVVGSQRIAIEHPEVAHTFAVAREEAPDIPLGANLGAIQLVNGFGVKECQKAVRMIEADFLVLHLNPLQEALQPQGQTNWHHVLPRLAEVIGGLDIPVVVKEAGFGLSAQDAKDLRDVGAAILDVAGAGGTCFAMVEGYRHPDATWKKVALAFADWGIPTAESIRQCQLAVPEVPLIASGGLRTGVDAAKALALGASWCAVAGGALAAASESSDAVCEWLDSMIQELRLSMFALGISSVSDLHAGLLTPLESSDRVQPAQVTP